MSVKFKIQQQQETRKGITAPQLCGHTSLLCIFRLPLFRSIEGQWHFSLQYCSLFCAHHREEEKEIEMYIDKNESIKVSPFI